MRSNRRGWLLSVAFLVLLLAGCSEKPRDLTLSEVSLLTGRAGPATTSGYFKGSIYNGNEGITVTEIEIIIATEIGGVAVARAYRNEVSIGPLETGDIFVQIIQGDSGADYTWCVSGGKGMNTK